MQIKYFNAQGDEINERSALDRHGMMRDGVTARIPLQIRDAAMAKYTRLHDGRGGTPGNRPGFVVGDTSHRDKRQQAYLDYDRTLQQAYLTNAWRDEIEPPSKMTGFGSGEFGAQWREGDNCIINGSPGTINSKGECIVNAPDWPGQRNRLDKSVKDQREAAYLAYDKILASAWRTR